MEVAAKLESMSLERCLRIMQQVYYMHQSDQNFSQHLLERTEEFLNTPDITSNPHAHEGLIREMKLEAILVTENSPYAEGMLHFALTVPAGPDCMSIDLFQSEQ